MAAEALDADALDAASLGLIHAYNPGLASSWMMQKAMSVRQGDRPDPQLINRMLVRAVRHGLRVMGCTGLQWRGATGHKIRVAWGRGAWGVGGDVPSLQWLTGLRPGNA